MHRYHALDSPLLRVSRPVAACSRCRAAKIKCDGKLPACTACEKNGRESECSSSNGQFAKGKERSYVASLELRVEKLEKRIAYARSRRESVAMHDADDHSEPPDRKDSLATIRAAVHGKALRKREATDVNELVSDFGFLSVNATTRDFESTTTNMTFARLILCASSNEPMPKPSNHNPLPSRPMAMVLIRYYLDNIYSLFPAFPETALFNAVDAIYQTTKGSPVAHFEYWLLFMVLGISCMAQSRSSIDTYYKDGVALVARALKYADQVLIPGYQTQMQALVLLVQYSMLDPAHFDSWHLIGFTCRALVDLGFHQDLPKEQQPDKITLDLRRKLFYCIYSLDRSISMVHARPFSFTDDSASVEFPSVPTITPPTGLENSSSGPHSLEAATLLFQLRRVQSTWYQELFRSGRDPLPQSSGYIWQMCHEMRNWSETFNGTLNPATRELFELELLYSYVYCLAPSSRIPSVPEIAKTLIFEYSIAYMHKIYNICRDPINTAFYTYHDALRVYFVGSQFMAVLLGNLDMLLNAAAPYTTMIPGAPAPPSLPKDSLGRVDNLYRSTTCIAQIIESLNTYGERWDDSKALKESFETNVSGLIAELHRR